MVEKRVGIREGIARFFAAYYVINMAIIASYALVRLWFLRHTDLRYSKFDDKEQLLPKAGLDRKCTLSLNRFIPS